MIKTVKTFIHNIFPTKNYSLLMKKGMININMSR